MNSRFFEDFFSPEIVWGYNCKNKVAHLATSRTSYESLDYRHLVHPDDIPQLTQQIVTNQKQQRRRFQRSRQLVSLHRVRDPNDEYHTHVCLLTITRDKDNRLAFIFGIDYRIPSDAPLSNAEVQYLSHLLRNAAERLSPFFLWVTARLRNRNRPTKKSDPFFQTWRCGNHYISPSLFQMTKIGSGISVELSEKQARFVGLLLGAVEDGAPTYVKREITRSTVFGTDSESRVSDNDIDQLVKFFRQRLGRLSIRTKRGYGHLLKSKREVCEGEALETALQVMWTAGDHSDESAGR
ncbi:MAG: hypothetical protein AB8G16_05680 [Gammaproteobacteria bacterium]